MSNNQQAKTILIVDDEPAVVTYLEMLLRDSGYETLSASNGNEGMDIVRQQKPDLVTLDISMPEATGTRFYKEIKTDSDLASIPVIIVTAVTGYGGDPYAYKDFISHRKLVAPPEGFFPKPIDRDEFLAAVNKLLA
jgi:CheY-like chemotaxis protein